MILYISILYLIPIISSFILQYPGKIKLSKVTIKNNSLQTKCTYIEDSRSEFINFKKFQFQFGIWFVDQYEFDYAHLKDIKDNAKLAYLNYTLIRDPKDYKKIKIICLLTLYETENNNIYRLTTTRRV
jgi:hypothetical protein